MRVIKSALCTTVAAGLLAGCAGNMTSMGPSAPTSTGTQSQIVNGHYIPHFSKFASLIPGMRPTPPMMRLPRGHRGPKGGSGGIYVSEFYGTGIWGYPHKNTGNGPATCNLSGISYPNGIAVDGKGNLIDPDGGSRSIIVFNGPGMCGTIGGTISDGYGQPSDASSADALNGKIVVGNIFDNSGAGSISVCTVSGGCTSNLTNPNMYEVAGVAMDNSGNCWADAINSAGTATLTYFAGCTGSGQAATGFTNAYFGGLDIDNKGNLVTISAFDSKMYVYKGCNPSCSLVGGPFSMQGEAVFGHLNRQSMTFAAGDFSVGQVDVYYYSPTALTYWYSFNNGLGASYDVEGAAFNPRSKQ